MSQVRIPIRLNIAIGIGALVGGTFLNRTLVPLAFSSVGAQLPNKGVHAVIGLGRVFWLALVAMWTARRLISDSTEKES